MDPWPRLGDPGPLQGGQPHVSPEVVEMQRRTLRARKDQATRAGRVRLKVAGKLLTEDLVVCKGRLSVLSLRGSVCTSARCHTGIGHCALRLDDLVLEPGLLMEAVGG